MTLSRESSFVKILLADDDSDDQLFFTKALAQVPVRTNLSIVSNGDELMAFLESNVKDLPSHLFLDLSMPGKTGFECLTEIKENDRYKGIRVIILSTSYARDLSYERNLINMLSDIGANDYIRKPGSLHELKENIHQVITRGIINKTAPDQTAPGKNTGRS